jgi:hypothetical protein
MILAWELFNYKGTSKNSHLLTGKDQFLFAYKFIIKKIKIKDNKIL